MMNGPLLFNNMMKLAVRNYKSNNYCCFLYNFIKNYLHNFIPSSSFYYLNHINLIKLNLNMDCSLSIVSKNIPKIKKQEHSYIVRKLIYYVLQHGKDMYLDQYYNCFGYIIYMCII